MPMFYTPKPRQFHYTPRFYDPEKEKWEALKLKYNEKQATDNASETGDEELAYFERRVSDMEEAEKRKSSKLGFRDLFRKREMPRFNYQPRFSNVGSGQRTADSEQANNANDTLIEKYSDNGRRNHKIKIRRRFDMGDTDYMKPVSAGKIMLYALLACILLYLILF